MSARAEVWLWLAQRLSAAVLALCVIVHLGTIVYAVQGGLSAAEIVGRVAGNGAWLAFYGIFVGAAAIHAPVGLRTVLGEMTALPPRFVDVLAVAIAVGLAWTGLRAAIGLYGLGGG